MYAIVKTGGKQYKVAVGDVLEVEKVTGGPGDTVLRRFASEVGRPHLRPLCSPFPTCRDGNSSSVCSIWSVVPDLSIKSDFSPLVRGSDLGSRLRYCPGPSI